MNRYARLSFVALVLLLPACEDRRVMTAVRSTSPSQSKTNLEARFEAASGIIGISEKDEALVAVAVDAAQNGDAEVARKSLQSIVDISARDRTAYTAAVALARANKANEANELASLIVDVTQRDAALGKIAKGE